MPLRGRSSTITTRVGFRSKAVIYFFIISSINLSTAFAARGEVVRWYMAPSRDGPRHLSNPYHKDDEQSAYAETPPKIVSMMIPVMR